MLIYALLLGYTPIFPSLHRERYRPRLVLHSTVPIQIQSKKGQEVEKVKKRALFPNSSNGDNNIVLFFKLSSYSHVSFVAVEDPIIRE